jgi:hypothetical protein
MKKVPALIVSSGASLLLAWTGWLLFGGLAFSPKNVMDLNWLASLFTEHLLTTLTSLVLLGMSMGIVFYVARRLEKFQAVPLSFLLIAIGGLPLVLSMDLFEFLLLGLCLIVGGVIVAFLASGERCKGLTNNIGKGMGHAKKAFYVFAIASFIIVFLLATVQHDDYEETFRNNIKDLVAQSSGTMMSKDQIRALVNAQLGSGSSAQTQAMLDSINYSTSKAELVMIYQPLYDQLNAEGLAMNLDNDIDAYYAAVNSAENIALKKQRQQEALAQMAAGGTDEAQIDALVDKMYEQFNDPEKAAELAEASTQMLESIPMFKLVLEWLGFVYAFAFVSLVLVVESIIIGPAAGLSYSVMCWLAPEDKEEEELKNRKPAEDKNVKELVGAGGFSREKRV